MERERGGSLALLVLANALPIGAVATFLVLRAQGKASLQALPAESVLPLVLLGVALAGIVVLGWGVFPRLRSLRAKARSRARGFFAFFWSGVAFVLLVDMAALAVCVLGLFAAELFLLARFALAVRR